MENKIESCLALKKNLEAVFKAIYDGIISLDNELTVVDMNEAAELFFGVKSKDVVGKLCSCEELLPDLKDLLKKTVEESRPIKNYSVQYSDIAGDERTMILSTAILKDENGEPSGVIVILHDISEIRKLEKKLGSVARYYKLVGKNSKVRELYDLMDKVAQSEAPVLIEGESGVGKGLIAEAIHKKSKRGSNPFVKINCAALSESVLESELFGHVKGAYTGAIKDRIGRFEQAAGGTVFLDEIGEISHSMQVKLLTVLQDKTIERVGETIPRKVDIRIISATNKNLKNLVAKKVFREDLYYRVKVVRIEAPALRHRVDDIELLASHFIEKNKKETGKPIIGLSSDALKELVKYRWPGNIRELENAIAQAFVLCDEGYIEPLHLPEEIGADDRHAPMEEEEFLDIANERERIETVLEKTAGQKSKAAKLLGIDRTTLWRKMKEYQL